MRTQISIQAQLTIQTQLTLAFAAIKDFTIPLKLSAEATYSGVH